jgi:glycosyltransferase involved in cell wall biosynthesis
LPVTEPALTVVIPVWGDRYVELLPRAIASVRGQEVPAALVVVDNAAGPALDDPPQARVVRAHKRLSAGAARNLGLAAVESEFAVFLDADDELADGALAALLDGIASDPAIAVYSMALREAESGKRHRSPRRLAAWLTRRPRLFALATTTWSLYPIQGNAALRTALVRDSGGYADCSGGEDWVLAASQAFRGRVVVDPRPGLIYHAAPESLWRRSRGLLDLLRAAGRVRSRIRGDAAVPAASRAALPLVAVAQTLLIVLVRPLYRAVRSIVGGMSG